MKVLMFGAGVIGTIYGYVLAEAGNDVTHYVRPGKAAALQQGIPLTLLDSRTKKAKEYTTCYHLKTVEHFSPADSYDLVMVSVRHYQLESVLPLLAERVGDADILFFNGLWSTLDFIDPYLPREKYLWGFPVAGGGFNGPRLDGALLEDVRLGEIDGRQTPRLARIARMFEQAGMKPDIRADIIPWVWVHFAINAGVIGVGLKVGSVHKLMFDVRALHEVILAIRDTLAIYQARGIDLSKIEDAAIYAKPAWLSALAMRVLFATNKPVRAIMERHTALDELKRIYSDVLETGACFGVPMPHLAPLKPFADARLALET